MALPSGSPVPSRGRHRRQLRRRPGVLGPVRDRLGRPGRPASCSTATRTGTRRPTRSGPRCRTRSCAAPALYRRRAGPALLAGSADVDVSGSGVQAATAARRRRGRPGAAPPGWTTRPPATLRLLAMPAAVGALGDAALPPRRAVRVGQGGGEGRARRAVRGVAGDAAVAARAARLPGHAPYPAARQPRRPGRGPARAGGVRQARRLPHRARHGRRRPRQGRRATWWSARWPGSASRRRGSTARGHVLASVAGSPDNVRPTGSAIVAGHVGGRLPAAVRVPRPAGRRAQRADLGNPNVRRAVRRRGGHRHGDRHARPGAGDRRLAPGRGDRDARPRATRRWSRTGPCSSAARGCATRTCSPLTAATTSPSLGVE